MSKLTGIWLITATFLVIIGMLMFVSVMTVNHWDFTKLSTVKYESNTYQISEKFNNIAIETETANILFMLSDDESCKVVCYEQENVKHSVTVQDGTLTIHTVDERKWYEYIGIMVGAPKITVYLPENEYTSLLIDESTGDIELPKNFAFESIDVSASTGDVKCYASASESMKIKLSTGDIHIENASAKELDLSVSTGKVTAESITCEGDVKIKVSTGKALLTDVSCKSLFTNGSTGRISLKNVIATEKLSIERSTGNVTFDGCDAAEIFVKTSTGSVKGSLLSDKVFIAESDTGRVDVPKTVTGGRCEITTNTGSIKIEIK